MPSPKKLAADEGKDEQQPSPSDDYGTQALPVTVSEKSECGC